MSDNIDSQTFRPNFAKMNGLLPAVVQDDRSLEVLMVGFMNQEAYARTLATGCVTFYSRTRQALWTKGETSGNRLTLKRVLVDCDRDTLVLRVDPAGPVCHEGFRSCFFRELRDGRLERMEEVR